MRDGGAQVTHKVNFEVIHGMTAHTFKYKHNLLAKKVSGTTKGPDKISCHPFSAHCFPSHNHVAEAYLSGAGFKSTITKKWNGTKGEDKHCKPMLLIVCQWGQFGHIRQTNPASFDLELSRLRVLVRPLARKCVF